MANKEPRTAEQLEALRKQGFQPGRSGNPAGRPKGVAYLSDNLRSVISKKLPDIEIEEVVQSTTNIKCYQNVLREMINEGLTFSGLAAFKITLESIKGNVSAFAQIGDRTEGRPSQELQHTGSGGGPIMSHNLNLDNMSDEKLNLLESLLLEASEDGNSTVSEDESEGSSK